ncbi:MAG: hypothetical protein U1E56_08875 [Bauldia sp.]
MHRRTGFRRTFVTLAALLGSAAGPVRAGHDALAPVDAPIKRYSASIVSLGPPDKDGHIHSFTTSNSDFRADELKSWRLTFVSGELLANSYQVAGNSAAEVTLTDDNGPIDALRVGDLFLVEQVFQRRTPAPAPRRAAD